MIATSLWDEVSGLNTCRGKHKAAANMLQPHCKFGLFPEKYGSKGKSFLEIGF